MNELEFVFSLIKLKILLVLIFLYFIKLYLDK